VGVQLTTDGGPVTVTWTNTFHAHGVEVFPDPLERHLLLGGRRELTTAKTRTINRLRAFAAHLQPHPTARRPAAH
jgi:hypothetical protein